MELALDHVRLHRLEGLPGVEKSDVWNKSIRLQQGKRILIKAPSGLGKSSLIALLYGLTVPHDGSYCIDGAEADILTPTQLSQLRSGPLSIVFQDLRLFDQWTVKENLLVKERLNGIETGRIERYCAALEIEAVLDRPINTLSLGQQQRVAIIRALLQPFRILLMDEPFSHIDPATMRMACVLIDQVTTELGAGLIITSLDEIYPLKIDTVFNL